MYPKEYKAICGQPNAFSRFALEETARALAVEQPALSQRLMGELHQVPVPKPAMHNGGPETDFFQVELTEAELEQIISCMFDCEAAAVSPEGDTTPQASYFAALVDCWSRYAQEDD